MSLQIYDLTHTYGQFMPEWPSHPGVDIDVLKFHARDGVYEVNWEGIMHRGTHMDAPLHVTENKVQAAFARLAKGKTVLMIAHRLSTVANADCIYVVQDGQIAESGTKDELCAQNGLFARMWQEYQASVQWKVAKEG